MTQTDFEAHSIYTWKLTHRSEAVQIVLTQLLRQLSMQRHALNLLLGEEVGNKVKRLDLVAENDHGIRLALLVRLFLRTHSLDELDQQARSLVRRTHMDVLLDRGTNCDS